MEYNKVAAEWWANKLRHIGPKHFDNGDDSTTGGYAMMMATVLAMEDQASNEAIKMFEKRLAEEIKEHVKENGSMILSVDYAPDDVLGNIADECDIAPNGFPWKTTMRIKEDRVSVSYGYGAPEKIIFPN